MTDQPTPRPLPLPFNRTEAARIEADQSFEGRSHFSRAQRDGLIEPAPETNLSAAEYERVEARIRAELTKSDEAKRKRLPVKVAIVAGALLLFSILIVVFFVVRAGAAPVEEPVAVPTVEAPAPTPTVDAPQVIELTPAVKQKAMDAALAYVTHNNGYVSTDDALGGFTTNIKFLTVPTLGSIESDDYAIALTFEGGEIETSRTYVDDFNNILPPTNYPLDGWNVIITIDEDGNYLVEGDGWDYKIQP